MAGNRFDRAADPHRPRHRLACHGLRFAPRPVWPSLLYIATTLAIPFVRDYQLLLALHFVRGLLLGVFVPATIMIVLHNLPKHWWIVGLAAYSFRLSFTGNAGVSLVGFYVDQIGWQWLYWQDAVVAVLMALLTWLGTPRKASIASSWRRPIGAACCCSAPASP